LVGDLLAPSWEPLPRARLGPMAVFSLTCGAVFAFFRARWGVWAAFAAAGALVLQPHLFALAHYATYDGLLTSLWVGCTLSFAKATGHGESRSCASEREKIAAGRAPLPLGRRLALPWVGLFASLLGCAFGTKLTGWFLPLPFLAWTLLYRDRRGIVV